MKKSIFREFFVALLVAVLCVGSLFSLTGCAPKTSEVVNLSLNPQIELIVDANDKVVSVNALNDEGNVIIANAQFVGLDVSSAVELFLETSGDAGFLVQGTVKAGENELKVEISGDDARALYEKIKGNVNAFLQENGYSVNFEFEKINLSDIKAQVEKAWGHLSDAQLNAMSKEELVALLKQSREETKEFLDEQVKELYYRLRESEYYKAKIAKISALMEQAGSQWASAMQNLNEHLNALMGKIDEFVAKYSEQFLSQTSEYQTKVAEYISAKKTLLEERLAGRVSAVTETLVSVKALALSTAKTLAETAIAGIQTGLNTTLAAVSGALEIIASFIDENVGAINGAIDVAYGEFKTAFETQYGEYVQNSAWQTLFNGSGADGQ